jgi:hypothetical protein
MFAARQSGFPVLRLQEEHRWHRSMLWRLDLVRKLKPSGRLLEIGCARGDFLLAARDFSTLAESSRIPNSPSQRVV